MVLVAEDNLPDALLVREVIRSHNLPADLHVVSDGEKALHFLAQIEADPERAPPDLIILDINLPKKSGFEVLQQIRASRKYSSVGVIVMSSSDSPADVKRARDLGAVFFRKPPDYDEFLKLGGVIEKFFA